jgi:cytochrome P450
MESPSGGDSLPIGGPVVLFSFLAALDEEMTRAPGPPHGFPGSHLLAMRRDPLAFLTGIARKYGDVARFRMGPVDLFLVNRPEWIRDVLVTHAASFHKGRGLERAKRLLGEGLLTSEDPVHLRQRRMMQPAFHHQRIAGYGEVMVEHAERLTGGWRERETRDVAHEMTLLTLGIVGRTLFDADVEAEAEEIGEALTAALDLFRQTLTLPFFHLIDRLPLPGNRRFARAKARIDATIYRLIAERRRAPGGRSDLLSMLLAASDTEGDGAGMSDTQVRDEAITIFLAGHETTANALAWTWHLLSQNPEAEARMHAELDAILGGRAPRVEDLPRLVYTEMVLAESMRLFPPAWILGRRAMEPYAIGGFDVPVRSIVVASQWVTHRDPRYFPDPERFDPERWRPEVKEARPKFSYFPFGGGPRVCIGEGFAWMEGILVLATIGRRWRLRLVPGQQIVPSPGITLRPRDGILMTLEKRG